MKKNTQDSVTQWIVALKSGNDEAAERLWDRYFHRLVDLARERLPAKGLYDEEDVALSVFDVFCRMSQEDPAFRPANRDELWRLLAVIAARKVGQRLKGDRAQKRGGLLNRNDLMSIDDLTDSVPPADFSVMMAEECQRLIAGLSDAELESLVAWKLDGYTNEEIAAKMKCSRWTVQRRIRLIQDIWQRQLGVVGCAE
jgi:DNA-directed RNA polymerase specialized sigma24 family protein